MGITDRLKDLKTKAVDATVERSDKIHEAVEKAATTADERTGGKYRERIQQVGAKADSLVDSLKGTAQPAGAEGGAQAKAEGEGAAEAGEGTPTG
jgi:DNA-binding protein H-NS